MPIPTFASALHDVRTLAEGPLTAVGTEVVIGATATDRTLFWVTSAGAIAGGPQYGPHAAATDVEVKQLANTGEMVWQYVFNDSAATIQRGAVVAMKAATLTKNVKAAPVDTQASRVVGVAQYDIADDEYGWILKKGVGEVLAGTGTIDVDEPICVDDTDAGTARESAGATDPAESFGWASENATATNLATCYIDCKG